jgi:secretion/DNA translocation related TadE-like protein
VTVVAAGVLLLCVVLALASADLTRAVMAASRAQTAADAAALAAAQALASPSGPDPLVAAREYAEANGGTVVDCTCSSGAVEAAVEVAVPVGPMLLLGAPATITRRARAVLGEATMDQAIPAAAIP